jgi:uncharacterized protein (TIRG00374 family)
MKRGIKKILTNKYFWFAIVLGLTIFAVSQFDVKEAFQSLKKVPLWTIFLIVGLQTFVQFEIYYEWKFVAKQSGVNIKYWDWCYLNSHGYVVESVTPGAKWGGEVIRAVYIRRFGNCGTSKAASVVTMQKLFSVGVFLIITFFAVTYMVTRHLFFNSIWAKIAMYAANVVLLLFITMIFAMPNRTKRLFKIKNPEKPSKFKKFANNVLDTVVAVRDKPKIWLPIFLLCAIDWLIYPLKVIILAAHFSPDIDILFLIGAVFVAYMVAMIPIFPGGLGGFEAAMAGILVVGGYTIGEALCITVIFRLVSFWYTILLSGVIIGVYKVLKRGKNGKKLDSKLGNDA